MKSFIEEVAKYYCEILGKDIQNTTFVFPSKRASLFFRHYISQLYTEPIFSPNLITLNDFIISIQSEYKTIDKTALLFELYKVYYESYTDKSKIEKLDKFIFWANIILKDFDVIDRFLVNADEIYTNLENYKEMIDSHEYITPELSKIIESVSSEYSKIAQQTKQEKEDYRCNFMLFWQSLKPLYHNLKKSLTKKSCMYEAGIYKMLANDRDLVTEHFTDNEHIVFVGLFQIDPAQMKILEYIKGKCRTEFCWDRHVIVLKDETSYAYKMMQNNVSRLGAIDGPWYRPSEDVLPEDIQIISCPGRIAEAKSITNILSEIVDINNVDNLSTAVILPDEELLIPAITSVPTEFKDINISIGYPLNRSTISVLVNRWLSLIYSSRHIAGEVSFISKNILSFFNLQMVVSAETSSEILSYRIAENSSYIVTIDKLKEINNRLKDEEDKALPPNAIMDILLRNNDDPILFLDNLLNLLELFIPSLTKAVEESKESSKDEDTKVSTLDLEFLYHYISVVKRLSTLINEHKHILIQDNEMPRNIVINLLESLIHQKNIPFEGDPLKGLQIMGMLESRSLDFENLVILSMEDGVMPKNKMGDSLIPFVIREGFGLPSVQYQDSIDTYRFYRLIGKAKKVSLLYNQNVDLGRASEPSRFISQLELLYGCKLKKTPLVPMAKPPEKIEFTLSDICPNIYEYMHQFTAEGDLNLSASAINTLIRCPLCFYYNHILKLPDDKDPIMLLDSAEFGDIVHNSMNTILKPYEGGKEIDSTILASLINNGSNANGVNISRAVRDSYYNVINKDSRKSDTALDSMYMSMCTQYVKNILSYDLSISKEYTINYIAGEKLLSETIYIKDLGLKVKGFIDRIDKITDKYGNSTIRIIDYKTGSDKLDCDWDKFYTIDKHPKAIFQTMLYCEMLLHSKDNDIKNIIHNCAVKPVIYNTKAIMKSRELTNTDINIKFIRNKPYTSIQNYCYQQIDLPNNEQIDIRDLFTSSLYEYLAPYFNADQCNSMFDSRIKDAEECNYCPISLS